LAIGVGQWKRLTGYCKTNPQDLDAWLLLVDVVEEPSKKQIVTARFKDGPR